MTLLRLRQKLKDRWLRPPRDPLPGKNLICRATSYPVALLLTCSSNSLYAATGTLRGMPMITSPSNPLVKSLRALSDAKQRRMEGKFLVEGVRVVLDALCAGYVPSLCLYDPEALGRSERGRTLLGHVDKSAGDAGLVFVQAGERAVAAACDTRHPQGIVAAFPIPSWPPPGSGDLSALALVCDDIQDPGNLGTILRSAEGAGVEAVWLTRRCVDLFSPKVVRAAMGAHFRLPAFPDQSWQQIEEGLTRLGIDKKHIYAADAGAAKSYDEADWFAPCALIVANEAHGLGREAAELAAGGGGLVGIPMKGGTESLNAAMAASIILFEAARQRRASEVA